MKNSNSFSILIWANKAKSDVNGLIPLYARVTVMGKRAEISLKKKVNPQKWDAKTGFTRRIQKYNCHHYSYWYNPGHYCCFRCPQLH